MIQVVDISEVSLGSIFYAPGHINTGGTKYRVSDVYIRVTEVQVIVIKSVEDYTTNIYKYNVYDKHLKFTHVESFQQAFLEMRILKGGWFHPDFKDKAEEAKTLLALE